MKRSATKQAVPTPVRLDPGGWFHHWFPELDFQSVFVAVTGCAALILYLYHGKPEDFVRMFPQYARTLPAAKVGLYSYLYSHVAAFVLLMCLPIMLSWFFLKLRPADLGVRFAGAGREFRIVLLLFLAFVPVVILMAQTAGFQAKYPKLPLIKNSFDYFVLYQAAYLIKWLAWEFFFRGYLLFGLYKRYGEGAILFSTMPFVVAHWGKPEAEIFAAIAAGFILCRLSLNGRSIMPGMVLHFLVAGSMDFMNCTFWR
jgi:membrane protease YdiL (CAAX protease family)